MIKVDAIGQVCPVPIIMTKNALKEIEEGKVEVSVDNKISLQNLEKLSQEMGYSYDTQVSGDIFRIVINKAKENISLVESKENTVELLILYIWDKVTMS